MTGPPSCRSCRVDATASRSEHGSGGPLLHGIRGHVQVPRGPVAPHWPRGAHGAVTKTLRRPAADFPPGARGWGRGFDVTADGTQPLAQPETPAMPVDRTTA